MALCQNLVPLVDIKIAGKWMFITLKMVLIGIDPYPNSGIESIEAILLEFLWGFYGTPVGFRWYSYGLISSLLRRHPWVLSCEWKNAW